MGFSGNVLKLDKNNNVEDFTFVLSTKNHKHIGKLNNVKRDTVHFKGNLNSANELSFEVNKVLNGETEEHWDRIIDLKSVYVTELNEYFEIKVTYKDELNEVKVITGTSLCEAELSQTEIYDTEINTEDDIARDDYVITKFYDKDNPKASLLHRVLSKAPHYSIKYVDSSLWKLQRSFSINGTSIYDFLVGECAEQFNCLFAFNSVDRSISVYDLYTVCASCGHRGDYNDVCPECGSTELNYFNQDTTIFVNKENLTDSVTFETDVDSIKNCFRLVAGDDNMTAAVRNLNQNGSQYLHYRSPEQEEDMSEELVERLNSYDELYDSYTQEYEELILDLYEVTDQISYLAYEKMPEAPSHDDDTENEISIATREMEKLTQEVLSPVGLTTVSNYTAISNVNNAIKGYARVIVNTGKVKVEISEGEFTYIGQDSNGWDYGEWIGKIKVTNFSDTEDVAETNQLKIKVYNNYEDYLKQKVMKDIADNEDEYAIFDVLGIDDLELFKNALKEYCLNRLESFSAALETALTTLQGVDQSSEGADFYEPLYVPYYNKLQACELEIDIREADIEALETTLSGLESRKAEIQKELDFETYLGEELYTEFCSYRREQEYSNSNYISDGLSNAEIMQNARDFLETAKKELVKSATRQHRISTNLYNLLAMEECKELAKNFALGNFIRVQAGKDIYRLRLISYEIDFSDLNTINVEFSDMTKVVNDMTDVQNVLSSASSMATTYGHVSKQAEKGEIANSSIDDMIQNGLNSANMKIKNNIHEDIVIDNRGITGRAWDDIENDYSPKQVKLTHNLLLFSEDNWRTASLGIGEISYKLDGHTYEDYGIITKHLISGKVVAGDIYSADYSSTDNKGTHINLNDGSFSFAGGKLKYDGSTLLLKGKIDAEEGGTIGGWDIGKAFLKTDVLASDGYLRRGILRQASTDLDEWGWVFSLQKGITAGESPDLLDVLWGVSNDGGMKVQDIWCKKTLGVQGTDSGSYSYFSGKLSVGTTGYNSNYNLYVKGKSWFNGDIDCFGKLHNSNSGFLTLGNHVTVIKTLGVQGTDSGSYSYFSGKLAVGTNACDLSYNLYVTGNSYFEGNISASAVTNRSSRRYKENITPITDEVANRLLDINVYSFDYKDGFGCKNMFGLIAEEVDQIHPIAVTYNGDNEPDAVDYTRFIPLLIKKVQMQQEEIDELKKCIN
jgi:hypothetical protein